MAEAKGKQFCVHDIPWIDILDINREALFIKSVSLLIISNVQGTDISHIHSANVEYHPNTPKDHGLYQQLVGRRRYVPHSGRGMVTLLVKRMYLTRLQE